MKDWIPLINKLVWPVIVGIVLLIFHSEVSEMYDLTVNRIKSGGSIEIGFFKLGDKATNTEIKDLSGANYLSKGSAAPEVWCGKAHDLRLRNFKISLKARPT